MMFVIYICLLQLAFHRRKKGPCSKRQGSSSLFTLFQQLITNTSWRLNNIEIHV